MTASCNGSVSLTIDGRALVVEPGTTVLAAARRLGIEIPTLCQVEGLEPAASCFLCAVQVEGRRVLSPSCALPAEEGMVVTTESADVRAARRMALELLLSDHAGECAAPCAVRCPAGLDVPGFVLELARGRAAEAMRVIGRRLALAGALGRVCPRLCEQTCRRCEHDQGLAIGALHRFAAERELESGTPALPPCAPRSGRSVAIVGAGPAGLSAAWFLLQAGHACTLYDAHPEPGGMLRYGIPAYRLPRAGLAAEIDLVRRLGARFEQGRSWGRDFTLADLRREHGAVFLAIGAQRGRALGCEGEELATSGIELLARVAAGETPQVGARVLVVGGGNTAMDAARTALRLALSQGEPAPQVRVLYRRTRAEMPCLMEEVEAAEDESVALDYLVAPVRLARRDDGLLELTCRRMRLGQEDESGRRRPEPIEGSEFTLAATTIVAATGQAVEGQVAAAEGLALGPRGIAVDARTLATNLAGVFAGGDAVLGPDLAVRAVAAGRIAAISIDQHLRGVALLGAPEMTNVTLRLIDEAELAAFFRRIEMSPRNVQGELDVARRLGGFAEIDPGLDPVQALGEAQRCLSCGCRKAEGCLLRSYAGEYQVDPDRFGGARRAFERDDSHPEVVYEPGKCIACDACVRIAAEAGEPLGVAIVGRGFDVAMAVPFGRPLSEGLRQAARAAAAACPTGALALRSERACDQGQCRGCDLVPLV